jgi:hypothetical protein
MQIKWSDAEDEVQELKKEKNEISTIHLKNNMQHKLPSSAL